MPLGATGFWLKLSALLILATALVGCNDYPTIERPDTIAQMLEGLAASQRQSQGALLSTGTVVVIHVLPNSTAIVVLASPGTPERSLGDELSSAIRGTPYEGRVKARETPDATMALVRVKAGRLAHGKLTSTVDIGAIVSALKPSFGSSFYVSTVGVVDASFAPPTRLRTYGDRRFAAIDTSPMTMTSSTTINTRDILSAIVYLLFFPLAIASVVLLGWGASRPFRSLDAKRRMYIWTAYPCAILATLADFRAVLLMSSFKTELLASWAFPNYAIKNAFLELIPLGIVIAAITGELFLFPPRPGKSWFAVTFRVAYPCRMLLLGLIAGITVTLPFSVERGAPILLQLPVQLVAMGFVLARVVERAEPLQKWQITANGISAFFGVQPPEVTEDPHKDSQISHNAIASRTGRVVIGKDLLECMSEAEMEFILAHEIAHFKYMPKRRCSDTDWRIFGIAFGLIVLLNLLISAPDGVIYPLGIGIFVIMLATGFLFGERANRRNRALERKVDADALSYTKELETAISALEKLHARHKPKKNKGSTHPTLPDRIANLREQAKVLGLSTGE